MQFHFRRPRITEKCSCVVHQLWAAVCVLEFMTEKTCSIQTESDAHAPAIVNSNIVRLASGVWRSQISVAVRVGEPEIRHPSADPHFMRLRTKCARAKN